MKPVTSYQCEVCGSTSADAETAEACEKRHMPVSAIVGLRFKPGNPKPYAMVVNIDGQHMEAQLGTFATTIKADNQ